MVFITHSGRWSEAEQRVRMTLASVLSGAA
jgi:hypothetical protein